MKKLIMLLPAIAATLSFSLAQTLELKWKTDTLLRVPESVLFDKQANILYVSSIVGKSNEMDGKGFISKVSPDGKIVELEWANTGLNAPKGMGMHNGALYVADLTGVAVFDLASGKHLERYEIPEAKFLNDITVDKNGDVYISDSETGKIFVIRNKKAALYFDGSASFKRINGLLALKEGLYVADAGTGNNYKLGVDKKLIKYTETAQGADGIVSTGDNEYIVSSWGGEVYYVDATGTAVKLLDTREQKLNCADIDYDPKTKLVFVPTFFGNSVMAYEFKK